MPAPAESQGDVTVTFEPADGSTLAGEGDLPGTLTDPPGTSGAPGTPSDTSQSNTPSTGVTPPENPAPPAQPAPKAAPSLTGSNAPAGTQGNIGALTLTAAISGGDYTAGPIALTATLGGLTATASASADGPVSFAFGADGLNALPAGDYPIGVRSAENDRNAAASASVGSLAIAAPREEEKKENEGGNQGNTENPAAAPFSAGASIMSSELPEIDLPNATAKVYQTEDLVWSFELSNVVVPEDDEYSYNVRIENGDPIASGLVTGNGSYSFTVTAVTINDWGQGTYNVRVDICDSSLSVCATETATLTITIDKTTPSIVGDNIALTYQRGEGGSRTAYFTLSGADDKGGSISINFKAAEQEFNFTVQGNGRHPIGLVHNTGLAGISVGKHDMYVSLAGDNYNNAVAPVNIGTIEITPAEPTLSIVDGGFAHTLMAGETSDISFGLTVSGAYFDTAYPSINFGIGYASGSQTIGITSNATSVGVTLPGYKINEWAVGTYPVTVTDDGKNPNNATMPQMNAGTITITKARPTFVFPAASTFSGVAGSVGDVAIPIYMSGVHFAYCSPQGSYTPLPIPSPSPSETAARPSTLPSPTTVAAISPFPPA